MSSNIYIGIDNGASGSIGVLGLDGGPLYLFPPTKTELNYQKAAKNITRIDSPLLALLLREKVMEPWLNMPGKGTLKALVERPFVNPGMFTTTLCAVRALEATIIALESLGIPYEYVDSRGWQKALLPEGVKGAPNLKKASKDIGLRLFPSLSAQITKQKDADGLLIAEWGRLTGR